MKAKERRQQNRKVTEEQKEIPTYTGVENEQRERKQRDKQRAIERKKRLREDDEIISRTE